MQLDYVGDEVQLSMNDPLREERDEAASQPDGDPKGNGNPATDLLPLPHQVFRPALVFSHRGVFVLMPDLKDNKTTTYYY